MLIHIINGPNLNLLGSREPEIYGHLTLNDIKNQCEEAAKALGLKIEFFQTNVEGELIDMLHNAFKVADGIILNAGAYTHTSVAIYDALKASPKKTIEVHLSNPAKREEFRHKSYVGMASHGTICGFGANSYLLAIKAFEELLKA